MLGKITIESWWDNLTDDRKVELINAVDFEDECKGATIEPTLNLKEFMYEKEFRVC